MGFPLGNRRRYCFGFFKESLSHILIFVKCKSWISLHGSSWQPSGSVSSKDRIYYNKPESEMQSTHRDRVLFLWWAFPHFPSGKLISGNTWDLHMFVILQVHAFFIICSLFVSLHVQRTSKCYLCYGLIMNKWHNARGEILYIIIFKGSLGHLIDIRCI